MKYFRGICENVKLDLSGVGPGSYGRALSTAAAFKAT